MIEDGKILDVQPVRDFSYALDFLIESLTDVSFHHLQNFIIWILILIMLQKLMIHFDVCYKISLLTVSLFGLNPCFWNTVCWISGRKHLLSALFILGATLCLVGGLKKNSLGFLKATCIILLNLLAIFSHPINVGWCIFLTVYVLITKGKAGVFKQLYLILGVGCTSLFCVIVNYIYYSSVYVKATGHEKFSLEFDQEMSLRILSWGRAFFQIILSYWPVATPYYPGSYQNLFGLIFLTVICFVVYKVKDKRLLSLLVYASLPLLVVTSKMTNIFGSDTYLISSGIGLYAIAAILLTKFFERPKVNQKQILIVYFILGINFVVFTLLSREVSKSFQSSLNLFERSYETEPTPFNLRGYALELNKNNNYEKALEKMLFLLSWETYGKQNDLLFSTIIFNHKAWTPLEKIRILSSAYESNKNLVWVRYYISVLYASQNEPKKGIQTMNSLTAKDFSENGEKFKEVSRSFLHLCKEMNLSCSDLELKIGK